MFILDDVSTSIPLKFIDVKRITYTDLDVKGAGVLRMFGAVKKLTSGSYRANGRAGRYLRF